MSDPPSPSPNTELSLDRYRARLGFWQAIWGTLISGGVAVAIPAAVDAYKARLDVQKAEEELALKKVEVDSKILDSHRQYISSFLSTAINQDIELRLRFAEYFSKVSDEKYRYDWLEFSKILDGRRAAIRQNINEKETQLATLRASSSKLTAQQEIEVDKLMRELQWSYAEVGYVRQNSNVTAAKAVTSDTPDLTYFESGMDITWDGDCSKGCENIPGRQNSTALQNPDRTSLDPATISYITLPAKLMREQGIHLGDFCYVYNKVNKKHAFAIVGDLGPSGSHGEGSMALASSLGIPADPHRGGVGTGIVYVVFPKSRLNAPITPKLIEVEGKKWFERWGGDPELQRRLLVQR